MDKKGVHMNSNAPFQEKVDKAAVVGPAFFADPDVSIKAHGTSIIAAKTAAANANTATDAAYSVYSNLVIVQNTKEDDLVKEYNLGVDDANKIYPHNEVKLTALGLSLSLLPGERPVPSGVTGASIVQSSFLGRGHLHCHHDKLTDYCKIIESISADPNDMSAYYPSNPQTMDASQCEVTPKNPAAKTWFRLIPHNTAGDGPVSAPFGGFSFH